MAQDVSRNAHAAGSSEFLIILGARMIGLLVGLLNQSLLAYMLLPEGRGAYAIVIMFGTLLGAFFSPGAGQGAQYFVMAQRMSLSQGVSTTLTICLGGGGLAVALAIPLVHSDLGFFDKADAGHFLLALVLIPLTAFSTAIALHLQGQRRFVRMAAYSSMQPIVMLAALLVLVGGLDLGVGGAIIAVATGHLFLSVVCVRDLRRRCELVWELPTRSSVTHVFRYGFRHAVAWVGGLTEGHLGSFLLGLTASRADIGVFSAGSAMMTRAFILPISISTVLAPRVAADKAGRPEMIALCARVTWWTVGAALAVVVALGEPLVRILLSEAFLPVVPFIWILAIGIFAYSGADMFAAHFRGINRPDICSWAMSFGMIANIVVFFALFQHTGVEAAAWGMTSGFVVRSACLLAVYCRTSRTSLLSICLLRPDDIAYVWSEGRRQLRQVMVRIVRGRATKSSPDTATRDLDLPEQRRPTPSSTILFLIPRLSNPMIAQHIDLLGQHGFHVEVMGFQRPLPHGRPLRYPVTDLGLIQHRNYLKRIPILMRAIPKIRSGIRRNRLVYAFNSDLAFGALVAGVGLGRPLILDVFDIQDIQTARGLPGRCVRALDRFVVERCRLLVLTSPAYRIYYRDWLRVKTSDIILRNKVEASRAVAAGDDESPADSQRPFRDRPLRIGYFSKLRDRWSLEFLECMLTLGRGKFEVVLAGAGSPKIRDLDRFLERNPAIEYRGAFRHPDDLPELFGSVDMILACYPPVVPHCWSQSIRYFEACLFRKPLIVRAGTTDGEEVARHQIGLVVEASAPHDAVRQLAAVTAADWLRWRANMARLTPHVYRRTQGDADDLAAKVNELL